MNFLEVYFNGALKHSMAVNSDVISIGRSASNDIVINNMGVSSHHAFISKQNDLFYIEDLNSTNGTFVNDKKISSQQQVTIKDAITIGKHLLQFSKSGQSDSAALNSQMGEATDATIMLGANSAADNSSPAPSVDLSAKSYHLVIRGESSGINKLMLTESSYSIGKNKSNNIRLGGWFTAAYIAEIEKIGHSFYINPLKKNKVKLNGKIVNSSTLLSSSDEITIKKLFLRFLAE